MPSQHWIVPLTEQRLPPSAGSKAVNLQRLRSYGFQIPRTYVCLWQAFERYQADDILVVEQLKTELEKFVQPDMSYAVRSSANIEDGLERSFAGQFKSILDVRSANGILQAVWSIWATAASESVAAYLRRMEVSQPVAMAVIVQEMVRPVVSGIALSRNPVTGAREVVVEAVPGRGDALAQAGVTPRRWINRGGHYLARPPDEEISQALIDQVVRQTRQIAKAFQAEMDLEWAWDGQKLYWLQARQITALNSVNLYTNAISKEMLPGLIKPLVWSVNIPLVSTEFVRFMTGFLGPLELAPESLVRPFYYRAYFNMGAIGSAFAQAGLPPESVEMMMGLMPMDGMMRFHPTREMLSRLPHMISFAHQQWTFHKRAAKALPGLEERCRATLRQDFEGMSQPQLLAALDGLWPLVQEAAYFNILCPMLSVMHNRLLEQHLKHLGVDPQRFDLAAGMPELQQYDPDYHLRQLKALFLRLTPQLQQQVRTASYAEFQTLPDMAEFQAAVAAFLEQFGSLSDNGNDFSTPQWHEQPEVVLGMIAGYQAERAQGGRKTGYADLKVNAPQRPLLNILYRRARIYRLLRERLSALYTQAYGLYRRIYLALGAQLVQEQVLQQADDIFYLHAEEVRLLAHNQAADLDARELANQRRVEMERVRDISVPTLIYGEQEPVLTDPKLQRLSGLTTSGGSYTGLARVVRGIQDFHKVQDGDVLVIPYSDVGWSPLFARAGAVVAESGGLLSHSSIIAREYGIPAIVSVAGAMNLADSVRLTVDGFRGEVVIHSD